MQWNEMPAVILINKKYYSHLWFLASKCDWGLLKLRASWCCHPHRCSLRSSGNASSSHLPHRPLLKLNEELRRQTIRRQNLAPDSKLVMGREAWCAAVHGVWTGLSYWTEPSWSIYGRNEFSEPRGLHLSVCRRMINSLTWYLIFSTSQ